jgi:DNA-binding IclR family transcriptional regulator
MADDPQTVSTLARSLGLPKSTVHGLCATLVNMGLLVRRSDASFRVGPHVMRWANAFLTSTDLTAEFAALWDDLKVLPNGTITLSVLDGTDVVYIGCRNSGQPLGITFRIGMRLPAIYTATGKAFLSTMSDARVREMTSRNWPEALTSRSVRNVDTLLRELKTCRERGYSIDDGQTREGMYCIGAVVRDSSGQAIAGVAVSLLAEDISAENMDVASDSIQKIAQVLSMRLGAS